MVIVLPIYYVARFGLIIYAISHHCHQLCMYLSLDRRTYTVYFMEPRILFGTIILFLSLIFNNLQKITTIKTSFIDRKLSLSLLVTTFIQALDDPKGQYSLLVLK